MSLIKKIVSEVKKGTKSVSNATKTQTLNLAGYEYLSQTLEGGRVLEGIKCKGVIKRMPTKYEKVNANGKNYGIANIEIQGGLKPFVTTAMVYQNASEYLNVGEEMEFLISSESSKPTNGQQGELLNCSPLLPGRTAFFFDFEESAEDVAAQNEAINAELIA
jgi:hypothetical protein